MQFAHRWCFRMKKVENLSLTQLYLLHSLQWRQNSWVKQKRYRKRWYLNGHSSWFLTERQQLNWCCRGTPPLLIWGLLTSLNKYLQDCSTKQAVFSFFFLYSAVMNGWNKLGQPVIWQSGSRLELWVCFLFHKREKVQFCPSGWKRTSVCIKKKKKKEKKEKGSANEPMCRAVMQNVYFTCWTLPALPAHTQ